jgi:8-oxo-dGTP diphosphatase
MAEPVRAAGGAVWRKGDDGLEVLLVHRPRYDDWSLPKGKAEPGEDDIDTALREVWEETGLRCELGPELARIHYIDHNGRPKVVRYWAMTPAPKTPEDRAFTANSEVDALVWLGLPEAMGRLSYERDRPVLEALPAVV